MEKTEKKNFLFDNALVRSIGAQKIVVVLVLVVMIIFFSFKSSYFLQYSTLLSIMDYTYYLAFLGIGVTFCLITGGVDLSIGTGLFCYALFGGYLITVKGMPAVVGIIATLAIAVAMGFFNGIIVSRGGHAPFLATLCTMMIARGLGAILTGGTSITWPLASQTGGWVRSIWKLTIGETKYPLGFVWVVAATIIMTIFLNKTRAGRYIIAIGSNKEATRLSGVNVANYQMLAYVISGLFTGIGALAYASAFQSMAPGNGAGIELNAIGGAIIGGTSMNGGSGSVVGTLLGIFIMSILQSALPQIGLQANYQQIIIGIVLLIAVYIDVLKNKKLDI